MDDLLNEFLTETSESLAVIDLELVKFERSPNDKAILQNIFRLVHTIKGTCGFLGLPRLESVAHSGENVLGKFRDGALDVTPDAVSLILRCIDRIRSLLADLEANGEEPAGNDQELINALNAMADGKPTPQPKPKAAKKTAKAEKAEKPAEPAAPAASPFPVAKELLEEVEQAMKAGKRAASDAEITAEMVQERTSETTAADEPAEAPAETSEIKASVPAVAADGGKALVKKDEATAAARESAIAAQSIRVNVELLEDLMTLVSELVLTRNQLLQMVRGRDDSEFKVPLQRLSHITTDLQEGVMKTRMQPIGNAWAKLPRIVRDLAVESGKKIDLQMIGADTELDRQVLELIKDPLTHMVRNSADHGLEAPVDRRAKGKPETGVIKLNAYHEGGHIIIEIADDGKGLSTAKIKAKAIQNGILTEAEAEGMTEQQVQQFIMRPGFSTAEKVTSVSGRGVGMDVVKTNVEKIGGTIEFKSAEGRGTTFTIKIPLTLAIVSALIVECSGERFAIPQISVLELVRAAKGSDNCIEMINQAPVLRLRDRLLPLVSLRSLFKLGDGDGAGADSSSNEVFIVVTQVGTYTFGIIVDRVYDTEEIVVKPVAPILRHIPYYSGNTILGDGSVIMILDPNGIASTTGQQEAVGPASRADAATTHVGGDETTSLLIFRAGGDELKAVPLALVARLEEIAMTSVEHSHGHHVVQYRGQLMPLIPFNPGHTWKTEGGQPILVFTEGERSMGLVVDEIVDIVDDKLKIELAANQSGLLGSAVVNGKATDVVDAGHYLLQAFADWFGGRDADAFEADHDKRHVLLVDDSPFFLNLLGPMLTVAGYKVTAVKSAEAALALREEGVKFDAIISDIEMEGMNGFQFAKAVRSDGVWENVPLVAMSSHATPKDFERGREVGFTDYVAKYDRDGLIQTLAQTFRN